mmetsp:Transcript_7791/g.19338  ORF Transcript_7791/g.19338 Transcript_7791/m.19338 type:complete len:209 (-) Transcript_7791:569-1195(-)
MDENISAKASLFLLPAPVLFCSGVASMSKAFFRKLEARFWSNVRRSFHLLFFVITMLAYMAIMETHLCSNTVDGITQYALSVLSTTNFVSKFMRPACRSDANSTDEPAMQEYPHNFFTVELTLDLGVAGSRSRTASNVSSITDLSIICLTKESIEGRLPSSFVERRVQIHLSSLEQVSTCNLAGGSDCPSTVFGKVPQSYKTSPTNKR